MKFYMLNYTIFYALAVFVFTSCSSGDDSANKVELDTVAPTINCQESITINVESFVDGAEVTYETPKGSDNVSAITSQIEGLATGAKFPIGTTINTFEARDAAGNKTTCSFEITVVQNDPSVNLPYFINANPTPEGKKWTKVENMSDEFNGTTFDDDKWHRSPSTDGFNWIGRPPGLFESDNVSVNEGNMNVTTEEFEIPKTVNGIEFTHGGAIVRSKLNAKHGHYYECRMQANKTIMSSTFWISFQQNCNTGPLRKLELDIQECVGRLTTTAAWAADFDHIYASNTWRHERECDTEVTGSLQSPAKTVLEEKNNSRYFVYGCWWKSPTEILFYLDGQLAHTITNPPADFDLEGHLTMAIETYDWNPIDSETIFETGSFDDLTTKYDWIRSWKLEDE
ncbi:HYR domain-containing protein [Maribacter sp. 1_MG-2023]|uniref:HYR domain-containing protein n=1 Tax=Maribacter sp. 1_MG-2023 TaxID=3062677 RepID=UPI0026E2A460|nr:HYR domain-containing protein [Maribacter sp. 1_MG-2023]MDO6470382.1 HYR domain-containing protein [Maribacter sp. 1_MG-2023]